MAIKIAGTTVINDSRNIQNIGIATATTFSGQVNAGVGTITTLNSTNVNVTGVTTLSNTSIANLSATGIATLGVTSTTNLTSQQLNVSGVSTLGVTSTTNLTSQQLNVSGVSTLGVTSTTNLTSQQLNVSGVSTLTTLNVTQSNPTNLNVSGVSTLGVTSTTNLTSQQLNVSGITTFVGEQRVTTGSEKVFRTSGNTVSLVYNSSTSSNIGYTTNPTGDVTLNVTGIPTSSSFDDYSITFAVIVNSTGTARTCTAVTLNGVSRTIRWAGGTLANSISGVTTSNGHTIFSFTGINTVGSASTTTNYQVFGVASGGFF